MNHRKRKAAVMRAALDIAEAARRWPVRSFELDTRTGEVTRRYFSDAYSWANDLVDAVEKMKGGA